MWISSMISATFPQSISRVASSSSSVKYYFKPIRELPAGRGFAGLVFLPRKEYPELPALLVELKWNQSVNAAISQIKDRKYMAALEQHTGETLLVEVNLITRPRPIPIPTA